MDRLDCLHDLLELSNEKIDLTINRNFKKEEQTLKLKYNKLKKELENE